MTQTISEPQMTEQGVVFTVSVEYVKRECLISLDALDKLSSLKSGISSPMDTFHAFEANIKGVARRMVAANVQGTPLQLGPQNFR